MELKQILLVLSPACDSDTAVELAAHLARREGARVDGVCLYAEPAVSAADSFAVGMDAVGEVLEREQASVDALTAPAASLFKKTLIDPGFSDGWTVGEIDEWGEAVLQRARLSDLVLISGVETSLALHRLAEKLALASGAPCLIVPARPAAIEFDRIVLAWNGSREAKRAMDDSLPWLQRAKRVAVVIVQEDGARSVDGYKADALIRRLGRHGVEADVLRVDPQGRAAGNVLLDQCRMLRADLLVMGAFGHSRASELILGGATRRILQNPPLPVLLSH